MASHDLQTIEQTLQDYNVSLATEQGGVWSLPEAEIIYQMIVEKVAPRLHWRSQQPDLIDQIQDTPAGIFRRMFRSVTLYRCGINQFTQTHDNGKTSVYYAHMGWAGSGYYIKFSDAAFTTPSPYVRTNPPEATGFRLPFNPAFLIMHEFGHITYVKVRYGTGLTDRNTYFVNTNAPIVTLLEQLLNRTINTSNVDDLLIAYSAGHCFAARSAADYSELAADAAANWYNDSYTDDQYGVQRRRQMDDVIGQQLRVAYGVDRPTYVLRGLHGDNAVQWLRDNQIRGWAVEPIYASGNFGDIRERDYSQYADAGIRVILRWNHSYASYDGGGGTYPIPAQHDQFINWCAENIKKTHGVWGHILGNEPNNPAESPRIGNQIEVIKPDHVVKIFKGVRQQVGASVRLSPPALDPTNAELYLNNLGEEPLDYFAKIVQGLQGTWVDFFALHAYSYYSTQRVDRFYADAFDDAPLQYQYYSIRMWEPFASKLRKLGFGRIPIVITETNHQYVKDSNQQKGWDTNQFGADWIHRVCEYIRDWNAQPGDQYVHGVCFYRYQGDVFTLQGKQNLLDALRSSGERPI